MPAVSPSSVTMSVSGSLASVAPSPGFPLGMLEALTHAYGREAQALHGRLMTRVWQAIAITDTSVLVESTLGWPDSGQFWCDGILFTYTSKTDGSFLDVTSRERPVDIPARTEVVLHVPSAPPE